MHGSMFDTQYLSNNARWRGGFNGSLIGNYIYCESNGQVTDDVT